MSQEYMVKKRDGREVMYNINKVRNAVYKSALACDRDRTVADQLAAKVAEAVDEQVHDYWQQQGETIDVEKIQDYVELELMDLAPKVAKTYIIYRYQHEKIRNLDQKFEDAMHIIDDYLNLDDWKVSENSNMSYSLQGLNNHISSEITGQYWLQEIYSQDIREHHLAGDLHVHDLSQLSVYCCGWDLQDLLVTGFGGVDSKVESDPPKHFDTALMQTVNFLYTLQGESSGAQAFSNFDTYLAPFIAYDDLSYGEVKQAMQEFIYNLNVPTRVGFQCLSEDTEILTPQGWKKYDEVEKGDIIKTFNVEENIIETKEVKKVFRRHYEGKMFNLKNRIQDQLISPGHRVVRKKFNTVSDYCLQEIDEITENFKTPPIIPIAADNNNQDINLLDEEIKLIAWIVAEGSLEVKGNWRQATIYQSQKKSLEHYEEIISLLEVLDIDYQVQEGSQSLGDTVTQIRFNADNSRNILKWFDDDQNIKQIPEPLLEMSQRQSRIFLEVYIRGDGHEGCKITTSSQKILEELEQITVNAGYGFTVGTRQATSVGNKLLYILRIIRHKDTYIQEINEVDYKGVIWSVNTDNETVIAKRKGKVFITGNTPFTNITLDLTVPDMLADQPVIIGGEQQNETYSEFQDELDLFNKAFAEIMLEGDKKGRVFSFPIPTYNITPDFDWDNEVLDPVWEMTAKYGIPYFSNFVNSDMNPDDVRSMCCRLRLNNKELRKRGGGLFGANPMTGSIGVVTINLARIGYLSDTKDEFIERLADLMEVAKDSLETKRKVLEKLTARGLYPYAKFYLRNVKERFDEYWKNHFNTIGILGMNEALLNFIGQNIGTDSGREFALEVMDFIRDRLQDFQERTGNIYNLEATPGESTAYRFAKLDKEEFGSDVIVANEERVRAEDADPYYTNSTQLPVGYTDDIFTALELQDDLLTKYTGGCVHHGFIGERMPDIESTKLLVKRIAENFSLPYYSLTPTFSICPVHGYLAGEHEYCPKCDAENGYVEEASE
ncbi:MAG: ribonucleoside triphosphate reductase [Bacillota bacterium]